MTFPRFLRSLGFPATPPHLAVLLALLLAAPRTASAQGTTTPDPLPPLPAEGPGTPSQPPPGQPPPVIAVRPAPPPQRNAPREEEEDEEPTQKRDAPPPRRGFQIAVRPGVAIPLGSYAKNLSLSDVVSPQFGVNADIGVKIIPSLFLGGYVGLNVGSVGGSLSGDCDRNGNSCSAITLRIGVQAQLHLVPDGKVDPWLGYGIGYEATGVSVSGPGTSGSLSAGGIEFAHLMAGVDFRISKIFGVGPYADLALGQYTNVDNGFISGSIDSNSRALHEWLTFGAKFTFFP